MDIEHGKLMPISTVTELATAEQCRLFPAECFWLSDPFLIAILGVARASSRMPCIMGDVLTTGALWIAFIVSSRAATGHFTYGLHRAGDPGRNLYCSHNYRPVPLGER